jgi:predicted XRE-type DNA-binding protein
MVQSKPKQTQVEWGSGNVFADLGLPDAGELQHKARLGVLIHQSIREQGLSQIEAARVLGVNQPKISALMNGKMDGFSLERLLLFLSALGHDVKLTISDRTTSHKAGRLLIATAKPDRSTRQRDRH